MIGAPEVQALPARLDAVLTEMETLVAQIAQEALASKLSAALSDASAASQGVSDAVSGVPDLVARLDAVAQKAESVEIDALAAELTALIRSADALIAGEGAQALPGTLNTTLEELRHVLAQLREGGVVENATAALGAADTFAEAGRDLPGLIAEAQAVLEQARGTLAGYAADNGVGRDARAAMREVERAARAVSSLARAIERNPNSLLLGR